MQQFIKGLTIGATACLLSASAMAQEIATSPHILPGPEHTMVMVQAMFSEDGGDVMATPMKPDEQFVVFRADGGTSEFRKVGGAAFPSSPADMEKKLGAALTAELLVQLKVNDTKAAYQLLQQHAADTLGALLFSAEVLEAFGITFVDRSRKPDIASHYRVDYVGAKGETLRSVTVRVDAGLPDYSGHYAVYQYLVSDSAASVSWRSAASVPDGLPVFANVYRRSEQTGPFEQVKRVFITGSETSDSSWVHFNETLPPVRHLAYYMQLEDFTGNKGATSDTLYTIAFDRAQLSGIANLQVTDTAGGLLLTWDPLPKEAVYSAIQILKSRELGADYVVVDTISAWETAYLDEAVVPASSYYYKVRPLLYQLAGADAMNFAEANGHKSMPEGSPLPAPPRDVRAELTGEGMKISWQHGDELNLFGYYVLRGPSAANLEVVSQPVQDTVYIDSLFSPGFSGQLHYAIQVADLSQQVSDTSEVVSVAIAQPVVLSAPGGMQARHTLDGVALQWENAMLRDDLITGFVVYRKRAGTESFELLVTEPLRLPFFTDSTAKQDESYEYAITSIDSWGNQSILSPTATIDADLSGQLAPPLELYLRNLAGGIEVSWPKMLGSTDRRYAVYRKEAWKKGFTKVGDSASDSAFVDKAVTAGTRYEYTVSVVAGQSEGVQSLAKSIRRQ